jgi:hypothetical protein
MLRYSHSPSLAYPNIPPQVPSSVLFRREMNYQFLGLQFLSFIVVFPTDSPAFPHKYSKFSTGYSEFSTGRHGRIEFFCLLGDFVR